MPTYEYVCSSCHRHTEVVQGFSDPPLTECPHCGGQLKRVFHPVGIVLKGSGFYTTDNRSSRKPTKPKDAPATETAASSESTSSSEAAPAPSSPPAKKPESSASPKKTEKK